MLCGSFKSAHSGFRAARRPSTRGLATASPTKNTEDAMTNEMTKSRLTTLAVVLAAALIGCGHEDDGDLFGDGHGDCGPTGPSADGSGSAAPDAGPAGGGGSRPDQFADAGAGGADADAGSEPEGDADAGSGGTDAGGDTGGTDAGSGGTDAGSEPEPEPNAAPMTVAGPCQMRFADDYIGGSSSGEIRGPFPGASWTSGPAIADSDSDGYLEYSPTTLPGGVYEFTYMAPPSAWATYGASADLLGMTEAARAFVQCTWWDPVTETTSPGGSCSLRISVSASCVITPAGNMGNYHE
jgi:hypothetical protein